MKRVLFTVLLMLIGLFLLSETVEAQKLRIYKKVGTMEEHLLSEIKRMEIKDMADNYIMLMYSGGSQTGNHSTSDIDSIKFVSGNMLVYHAGVSTQYSVSSLDSVVFKISSNSGGNDVVLISSGNFQMGNTGNYGGYSYEKPVHTVTLTNSYYMGKYEVTQALWKSVMGTNPSYFKGDSLPVEEVCWYEAVDFCNKLSDKDGLARCYTISMNGASTLCDNRVTVTCDWTKKGWRLPTEAEWEYACKAGTSSDFYSGQLTNSSCSPLDNNLNSIAWYCGNASNKTHNVGGKTANNYGLYDMSGNVFEWCWDWFSSTYYSGGAMTDPKGPSSGSYRVLRGGAWCNEAIYCRSAYRSYGYPYFRYNSSGFRICRTY
jgi:formylglycine-generating enzyme required for sulfatase activity